MTPQISGGDQVRLWLNPQVTTRLEDKQFTTRSVIDNTEYTSDYFLPNTSTQAVWTNVIVHDGDTLVLGGLVQDKTIKNRHTMPYLGDIPLLGFFFRGKSKEAAQSSLLIFVTPTIIDTTGARFFEVGANTGVVKRGSESAAAEPAPKAESESVSPASTSVSATSATEKLLEPSEDKGTSAESADETPKKGVSKRVARKKAPAST